MRRQGPESGGADPECRSCGISICARHRAGGSHCGVPLEGPNFHRRHRNGRRCVTSSLAGTMERHKRVACESDSGRARRLTVRAVSQSGARTKLSQFSSTAAHDYT